MTPQDPSAGTPGPHRTALEAVHNLRDLGGTPVGDGATIVPGRLLRAASLSAATPADIASLHAMGVGTVVDLRADAERHEAGTVPDAFDVHCLPLVDDATRTDTHDVLRDGGLAAYYAWVLDHAGERVVEAVEVVAAADTGVVVMCGAGKDRTGVVVASILALLDVPDDAIVADYAATGESLRDIRASLVHTPGYRDAIAALPREVLGAPAEAMVATLGWLDSRGGVAAHLAAHGLAPATAARLRARLVQVPAG